MLLAKGLPSVGSERRFRESVTRRERGGESLERELNTEQHQVKRTLNFLCLLSGRSTLVLLLVNIASNIYNN